MPTGVDTELAALSDQLILVTVLLYVAAMVAFAFELAFGRSRPAAESAREPVTAGARGAAAVRAAVGTQGSAGAASDDSTAGGSVSEGSAAGAAASGDVTSRAVSSGAVASRGDEAGGGQGRAAGAGTLALVLTWIGWAANLASIVTRGLAVDRWPWGNMYEFVVAICFAAVTTFLLMQLRYPVRFLGAFVTVAAALGLGFSVLYLYTQAGPVVPALNSYWVAIHVSAAVAASGLFIVAGVAGILYLVRKDGAVRLPAREDLERIAHRAIVIAFPIWTFAVIAGALWADKAWGRYWGWDPKEVWAFITWIAYAAYLHARATAGWRGRAAMIVQLVAFACLLFNLVGVNMFLGGLHSYADVP